ncbi:hypothetical protein BDV96DRAFT_615132 [Lophiotrema nucula]|uniref:CST complex subunit Stn1 N-terminal domain-containing protein n=1 Tax=Lophiotrema nucula TaxID=690887 RepID=A0A6A5YUV6_9PLEO|nr:hypothetical protein BDV96DRAFT_615132 [Lophiotrema nucula]
MSTPRSARDYRIYPAYCFKASPTYDTWVKLTAATIQTLRAEPDFQSQNIYFYLNHPIRFVRIVGVVVAIDDINVKYTVLTVDDGSGATIEVKIVRLTPDVYNPVESPSNTVIENLDVISRFGVFEVTVDHQRLDIGTVIKAKCTLSEFRCVKQLELKRIWVVKTTDEEAKAWTETAAFKSEVLSKPWRLTSTEHKKITDDIKMGRKKAQEYERMKLEHEARRKEHRKAREEYLGKREVRLESRRRKEEIMMNAGALV